MTNEESKKEILAILDVAIKKLAILIDGVGISDDLKKSIIEMIPKMSIEQIDALTRTLEAKFCDEQTKSIDDEYKQKLQDVVDDFDKKKEDAKTKLLKTLEDFEAKIKN